MQHHVHDDFNIFLTVADVVWFFGDELKLTRIAAIL